MSEVDDENKARIRAKLKKKIKVTVKRAVFKRISKKAGQQKIEKTRCRKCFLKPFISSKFQNKRLNCQNQQGESISETQID